MHQFRRFMSNCVFKSQRKLLRQSFSSSKWISTVEQPPSEGIQFSIPNGNLGQPTYHTHPHLISEGHLTCGVTQIEYKDRRTTLINKLMAEVGNALNNHVIVIPAAQKLYMSDKIPYVFRQNSDFFYLTGCMEPAAILVLIKPAQTDNYKSMLFVHDKDSHAELWEGPRTGCGAAVDLFAVDEALPVDDFHEFITQLTSSVRPMTLWYHKDNPVHTSVHDTLLRALSRGPATHADPRKALHLMRLVKSPAEVELMKDTCRIGAEAVHTAMACTRPGVTEHALTALLDYSSRQLGAEQLAFPPVVAGGWRATHIHYITNLQRLRAGELLLVDAGCQRWLYNSDLTRTWPVSGKFSNHQRVLYEIVLTVQKRLIALMNETRAPLDRLFEQMCRLLGTTLQQEGILPRNIDNNELFSRAYRLCPHHVSHYLGLDVHDTPSATRRLPLQPGMVVTVEPGLYIRQDDTSVPPEFRGIGIRIEDDVLITEEDVLVLTDACPKEVDAIETTVGTYDMNSWAATS